MVNTVTLKELRPGLPEVVNRIDAKLDRYIITKHGRPVVVMMSADDYESMLETIEILSDKRAVARIKKSKREVSEGKTISWEKLRRDIERV